MAIVPPTRLPMEIEEQKDGDLGAKQMGVPPWAYFSLLSLYAVGLLGLLIRYFRRQPGT